MMSPLYSRKTHVPKVSYDQISYIIKCPSCGKGISLNELENFDYCNNCGISWNKYAKSLYGFYMTHSNKLLTEYLERK